MRVSIIVPVLDEAAGVVKFLDRLQISAPDCEIVIADGGSTDGTAQLIGSRSFTFVQSARGRSLQMNAGAAAAAGEVLWFVHADTEVSRDCLAQMQQFLRDPRNVGGCFSLRIDSPRWFFRARDFLGEICVDLFRIALGDRALFCRRDVFEQIGRYRDLPLLEDGDFYRRLRSAGRVARLRAVVRTSPRRYEQLGAIRTIFVYAFIAFLFCVRVPMTILERILAWHLRRAGRARGKKSSL